MAAKKKAAKKGAKKGAKKSAKRLSADAKCKTVRFKSGSRRSICWDTIMLPARKGRGIVSNKPA